MNILFMEAGESGHGGSFVSLLQMIKLLTKKNHQLTVVLWNQSIYMKQYEALGARVIVIDNSIYTIGNIVTKRIYNFINKILLSIAPTLCVYTELMLQYFCYRKVIKVIQNNTIELIHLNNQPMRNFIGYWLAKKLNIPVITHLRTLHSYGFTSGHVQFIRKLRVKMLAVSNAVKECWTNAGITAEQIAVLNNPYSGSLEPRRFNTQTVSKKIVYIGRLEDDKGVAFLLESFKLALRSSANLTLSIIGAGSAYQNLLNLSMKLGLDRNINFLGYIKNAKQRLDEFDILILPSKSEGFGRVIIEAMAHGVCVIATKVGGICDIVEHEVNGLLVNYGDKKELANTIVRASKSDDFREKLIKQAYQTMERKFNEKVFIQQLEMEYHLISNHKKYDIAVVISDLGSGGTQRVVSQLIDYWSKHNKSLAVITFDTENNDFFKLPNNVDRYVLGEISKSRNKWVGLFANLKRIIKLRKHLIAIKPKKVISFLCSTNILTLLAARKLKLRVVISERNDPARQSFGIIWNFLRKKYYRQADIVTANTRTALETLSGYVPRSKLKWVQNPIAELVAEPAITFGSPTVLAVGRLHHQKAYDILLQAFSKFHHDFPEWRLAIIGEGDLCEELKLQTKHLGLVPYVTWCGRVENPFPYYFASQIFVMPSRHEGMPNALLEAINCDLPVIVSDALPGPLEYIQNEVSGLVVRVENVNSLVDALSRLAASSRLREQLAVAAKEKLNAHSIEQVIDVWDSILSENS